MKRSRYIINKESITLKLDFLQSKIEDFLTWRKKKKIEKKKSQETTKGEILDWINSFLFAVVVVYFVSLYFFQLYVIPSESMQTTLNVKDRVGVSKRVYGTEIYSFGYKTDSKWANMGDVIVFYNPLYTSKGGFRENIENFLFLVTFSLYNPSKEGKLYVKRSAAVSGDKVFFKDGDMFVKRYSSNVLSREGENTYKYTRRVRSLDDELKSRNYGRMLSYSYKNLIDQVPKSYLNISNNLDDLDYYTMLQYKARSDYHLMPFSTDALSDNDRYNNGTYINHGFVLPLGDNRDNSQDGRYFGPVSMSKVIGKGEFRFWPIDKLKML